MRGKLLGAARSLKRHVEGELGIPPLEGSGPGGTMTEAPSGDPAGSRLDPDEALDDLLEEFSACERCRLSEKRTRIVFGQGSSRARLMIIGEGPGAEEDRQGLAFVGRAGKLLTKMLAAIEMTRDEVYITNVVKCRPPGNRTPEADEMETCSPILDRQIEIIRPRLILALGAAASKFLLSTKTGITKLRGNVGSFRGIRVLPSFHPAYLLRSPQRKVESWKDLQLAKRLLDEEETETGPPVG